MSNQGSASAVGKNAGAPNLRAAMASLSCLSVPLILLGALAGCQRHVNWDAFDRIEVGRELPPSLPAGAVRDGVGIGYVGSADAPGESMLHGNMRLLGAVPNEDGAVVSKRYLFVSIDHSLLFVSGFYRDVLELALPQGASGEPPGDGTLPDEMKIAFRTGCRPFTLFGGTADDERAAPDAPAEAKHTPARTPAELRREMNIHLLAARAAARAVADAMPEAPCSLGRAMASLPRALTRGADAWDAAEARLRAMPADEPIAYPLRSLQEHALYCLLLLRETIPDQPADDACPAGPLLGFHAKWCLPRWIELLEHPSAFRDATTDGSTWRMRTWDGVEFRVRNLGAGRMRLEVRGTVVRDPLLGPLLLMP